MAIATSKVVLRVENAWVSVSEETGAIPWNEVQRECSYNDATLAKKLYPSLVQNLQLVTTKQPVPPVRMFDLDEKRFHVGLLDRVQTTLQEQGVAVELLDKTTKPSAGFNFEWFGPDPREYQTEITDTLAQSSRVGCVVAPTGSGKTLLMCKLIQQLGLRTLVVVYGADLVAQTADFIYKYLGIKAGRFGAGKARFGTVTVVAAGASLKKCVAAMEEHDWKPDLLFVDEFHCTTYNVLEQIGKVDAYFRYGMSATPFRSGSDSLLLEAGFGKVLAQVGIKELQTSGELATIKIETLHIPATKRIESKGATWEEVYKPAIVRHAFRNNTIRQKIWEKYKAGESILVDVEEIDHIRTLALHSVIPKKEIGIVTGKHKPKEREALYEKFRKSEIKVLIGTVLKRGLDLPNASVVVLAGGYKAKVRLLQKIGRGLRAKSGKNECVVVDTIDQQHYLTFKHCQTRFRTMVAAGFVVPDEAIRTVQLDIDVDTDEDIERLRTRQLTKHSGKSRKQKKDEDDYYAV